MYPQITVPEFEFSGKDVNGMLQKCQKMAHTALVKSRRCSVTKLAEKHPGHEILDLSSKGEEPWVRFSPFFPHGGIPIPFSEGQTAQSVEGVWQGLKVFETADIDPGKFENSRMKGLKRTVRRFGRCLGHRQGVEGSRLLGYREARYEIYLPCYLWVLRNCLQESVEQLRQKLEDGPVIFLDYETNSDLEDLSKPLSHAGLVARFLNDEWPQK